MITVKLPPIFYWDHVYRDLPGGTIVRETKTYVMVTLNTEEASEILSDANYYSDGDQFDSDMRSIVNSAQATVRALERAGVL